ncbi:MAG: hypothetical protein HAW62_02095 [Endozoicomonadaceae bacterium]|nr:hypothetical protein [Endozoicomonadaceae bacterium]
MVSVSILRQMADIALMASSGGYFSQAENIFTAIECHQKDTLFPHIGRAINCMNMGNNQEALEILEKKALPLEPDNSLIKAYKGLALMLVGRNSDSEKTLTPLIDKKHDEETKRLANELLNQLHSL